MAQPTTYPQLVDCIEGGIGPEHKVMISRTPFTGIGFGDMQTNPRVQFRAALAAIRFSGQTAHDIGSNDPMIDNVISDIELSLTTTRMASLLSVITSIARRTR